MMINYDSTCAARQVDLPNGAGSGTCPGLDPAFVSCSWLVHLLLKIVVSVGFWCVS